MDIRVVAGSALAPYIPDLARLRISVFADFPYLYAGSQAYEERYLSDYARIPDCVAVLALDAERVVGAATAMPLTAETDDLVAPFVARGHDPASIFYLAESVLEPAYRGQGVGVGFFAERERFARARRFAHCAFCAVIRPDDHPLRPAGHIPLDAFWHRRGYRPVPGLVTRMTWPDRGETIASVKSMQVWMRELD